MPENYQPKHAYRYNSMNDGTGFSRAECTGEGICPRHDPANYADCMACHAAAYDGPYSGPGSTI